METMVWMAIQWDLKWDADGSRIKKSLDLQLPNGPLDQCSAIKKPIHRFYTKNFLVGNFAVTSEVHRW